jgi:hypothetical protein
VTDRPGIARAIAFTLSFLRHRLLSAGAFCP